MSFKKKNDNKVWQRVANSLKADKSQRELLVKCAVTCAVTRSCYNNAQDFGLSMFFEFENLLYL